LRQKQKEKLTLKPLNLNPCLTAAASDHGKDIGPNGILSHKGSDQGTYKDRIERHCKWGGAIFEMIDYADRDSAKEVIISLLIDDGVPHRINRNKLLDSVLSEVGIYYGPHKVSGKCAILVYAA
jgi:uncharacterized protein YkwD